MATPSPTKTLMVPIGILASAIVAAGGYMVRDRIAQAERSGSIEARLAQAERDLERIRTEPHMRTSGETRAALIELGQKLRELQRDVDMLGASLDRMQHPLVPPLRPR